MLQGPIVLPEGKATRAVVFLHGFGSDGEDLISLAPLMVDILPHTAFFAPNAPERTNIGVGYQWFDDKNFTFINRKGIGEAAKHVETYLKEVIEKEHGIPLENTVIFGFSQGAMTSLFTFPRFKEHLAGVVASSGVAMWSEELSSNTVQKFPLLIVHGKDDDVVPYQTSKEAEKIFKDLGYNDVSLHLYDGLAHGIDNQSLTEAAKFILRVTTP